MSEAYLKMVTQFSTCSLCRTNRNLTLAMLLLDRSGSMRKFADTPREAANECLAVLKNNPGVERAYASIWTFNEAVTNDVPVQSLADIRPLQKYRAKGGTALYDAVGEALRQMLEIQAFADRIHKIKIHGSLSVITDGEDLHSRMPHTRELAFAKHAREANFDLMAVGIGIDKHALAQDLGFNPRHCHTVDASVSGVRHATHMTSVMFSRTMTGGCERQDTPTPPSSKR